MSEKQKLEVGDFVLCIVDRIVGTVVFVKIEGDGEGGIVTSEIAPGRIRNLRDYVVPKKKIVCKVLRISGDRIDLSLRRVGQKERKEVLERYQQEKSCESVLRGILGEAADSIIKEVQKKESVYDFCEKVKKDSKELEKIVGLSKAKKIHQILIIHKKKRIIVKKYFQLTSNKPNGLLLIKGILEPIKDLEVKYIAAGNYMVKIESEDPKKADNLIRENLSQIEKQAQKNGLNFSIKEK